MLTRSVALDRVNFFIAGSNLGNPFISVIYGSDDEECRDHGLNGYVDERGGAEGAEVRRGTVGNFSALGLTVSVLGIIVSTGGKHEWMDYASETADEILL